MRIFLSIVFFVCINFLFAQTNKISQVVIISRSDSVYFTVNTSGCFYAGSITYLFTKNKTGGRTITFEKETKHYSKNISPKLYKKFIDHYQKSWTKFSKDLPPTCTLITEFDLSNQKSNMGFKNVTCENDYNPEFFLESILK